MQRSREPENGRTSCLRVSMECRMAGKGNASPQPAEHHRKNFLPSRRAFGIPLREGQGVFCVCWGIVGWWSGELVGVNYSMHRDSSMALGMTRKAGRGARNALRLLSADWYLLPVTSCATGTELLRLRLRMTMKAGRGACNVAFIIIAAGDTTPSQPQAVSNLRTLGPIGPSNLGP